MGYPNLVHFHDIFQEITQASNSENVPENPISGNRSITTYSIEENENKNRHGKREEIVA